MAAYRSERERNTLRFKRRRVTLAKKPSPGIEPAGGSRREVERPAWMAGEPSTHLGMLVDCVVIADGMDRLAIGHLRLDSVECAAACNFDPALPQLKCYRTISRT